MQSTSSRETRCGTPLVPAGISMRQAHSSLLPRAGAAYEVKDVPCIWCVTAWAGWMTAMVRASRYTQVACLYVQVACLICQAVAMHHHDAQSLAVGLLAVSRALVDGISAGLRSRGF